MMQQQVAPGLTSYSRFEEGSGNCFCVENTSDAGQAVQFDAGDCTGCNFTRESSFVITALPPRSRQVVIGITPNRKYTGQISMSFGCQSLPPDQLGFALPGDMLHMSLPELSPAIRQPGNRPPPDEAILKRAPPEEPDPTPTAKRAHTMQAASSSSMDEELAEAIRMSMGPPPDAARLDDMAVDGDDEDDLAAAIRLSMQAQAPAANLGDRTLSSSTA